MQCKTRLNKLNKNFKMKFRWFKNILYVMAFAIICKNAQTTNWSPGWFSNGANWYQWDVSCKTWADSTGWMTCEKYMYYDNITKMWVFCQEGQYYDSTYQLCRNCDGKWTGNCKYQKQCFTWTEPKILDLETITCVDSCDSSKMAIQSSQYSLSKIWRALKYYVDPLSSEMIELGTIIYPYRSFRAISSDILNNFSHQKVNISVYLKEYTSTHISDLSNFFLNISSIEISSYSVNSNS